MNPVPTLVAATMLALSPAAAPGQPRPVPAPDEPVLYEVDAESSDVHWIVHRAGALRRFGHDHVISVGRMTGRVLVRPRLEQSMFEIDIPVERLVVDDPALRSREGVGLDSEPSAEDIAATRRNMLGEDVLDAEQHPRLRIEGTGPVVERGRQTLEVTVHLLGRAIPLTLPTDVELRDGVLEASGAFTLTHEMLGMEPFRAMMGALRVDEALDFSYRIVARRTG